MQLWRGLDMASFDANAAPMPRQEVLQYLGASVSCSEERCAHKSYRFGRLWTTATPCVYCSHRAMKSIKSKKS